MLHEGGRLPSDVAVGPGFAQAGFDTLRVGDSSLAVAEVLEVVIGPDAPPLQYYDRRFHVFDGAHALPDPLTSRR